VPIVCSITNVKRLRVFMQRTQPSIVFHAAAYKHVPLMEEYPLEAVEINTLGTYEFVNMAADSGVERFVLVSSDKAVRPSSVMGATKRIAELLVQAVARERGISCCAVRFGNVLGSRGSVIPLFEKQIANGGPVTVTDPHMMRYFMTIPEAARLIIHAAAMRDNNVIYMLDMGDEISILSLAERVIRMHGKEPGKDIDIKFVGLRPGEKLRESLSLDFEAASPTTHPKIRLLRESRNLSSTVPTVKQLLTSLHRIQRMSDANMIRQSILALVRRADGVVHEDDPVALTDREQAPSTDVVTDVPMYLRGEWRGKQYSDVPTVDQ